MGRLRPSRAALLVVTLLAPAGVGCAAQPVSRAKPRDTGPSIDSLAPLFITPARWDYHPPGPEGALAAAEIPGGGCVFTAEGGQRWTSATAAKTGAAGGVTRCAGKAVASEFLAPEDLVSVSRREGRPWLFVGASGALYEAAEPLAAFTRTVAPPEPFSRVSASSGAVLGATYEGKLLRWEDATGWRPVATPPRARVLDVAVSGTHALALAYPEALFTSDDSGATWASAGAPTIGAHRLGLLPEGGIGAQGIFESMRWDPAATPAFSRAKRLLPARSAALDVEVGRGASAPAVQGGRAAVDGDRYVEAMRPDTEGDLWQLARGRLEGRLELVPLAWSAGCGSVRIGLRNTTVYAVCVALDGAEIGAVVRRSRDGGSTWSEPLGLATPDTDTIFVSVSHEGNALLSGVCKPGGESGGCKPTSPLLIRSATPAAPTPAASASAAPAPAKVAAPEATPTLVAMSTGAPQLTGAALLPTFSFDGHSAYFLGHRGKDEKLTLFVSHDEGETFSQRSLEGRGPKTARRSREYEVDDEGPEEAVEDYIEVDETSAIHPGEDGTVGLMVIRYRGFTYVTTDEDGRVLHEAPLPSDDAIMAGFGRRLVAITARDGVGIAESSDGGATWDEQAAPAALGREVGRGSTAVVCSVAGCLFGETVTRVGWGGLTDTAAADHSADSSPSSAPAVLTPIVCDLAATTRWTRIDHVFGSGGARLPRLTEMMRGRSVWSALTSDPATGAASVISANLPESGEGDVKVATRALLAARPASGHMATALSFQMEGYAAVRAAIPWEKDGTTKPGASLRNVEVAWENFMEGSTGRGKIADAGPFDPHDATTDGVLFPSLITVSVKGLVLAPHAAPSPRSAFLVDLAGKVSRVDLPELPEVGLEGHLDVRGDVTLEGGVPFGTALVRDENGDVTAILLGKNAQNSHEISVLSLAPARGDGPLISHADWTYGSRTSIGVTSLTADRRRPRAWATFEPLHGDGTFGPPEALPTLYDLGDRPRPCSAADRAKAPRFEAIFTSRDEVLFAGMRHPVLVNEPPTKTAVGVATPMTLLTAGAIVHGSPASPCAAAWEATGIAKSPVSALISGDLARSWIFRVAAAGKPAKAGEIAAPAIEYRPMSCRYDAAAPLPEAIWNEKGTAKIER
jgi:hypothetical protein